MKYLFIMHFVCVNKFMYKKIYFLCGKKIAIFFKYLTNPERNFEIQFAKKNCERDPSSNCRIHVVVVVVQVQWIFGKGEDSLRSVPSTRNANLIGSWILSSARNYYLRYKSGDMPRLPFSQPQPRWTRPAVIIRVHTFTWLSRTPGSAAGSYTNSSSPCSRPYVRAPSRNVRDYPQVLITNLASANYN